MVSLLEYGNVLGVNEGRNITDIIKPLNETPPQAVIVLQGSDITLSQSEYTVSSSDAGGTDGSLAIVMSAHGNSLPDGVVESGWNHLIEYGTSNPTIWLSTKVISGDTTWTGASGLNSSSILMGCFSGVNNYHFIETEGDGSSVASSPIVCDVSGVVLSMLFVDDDISVTIPDGYILVNANQNGRNGTVVMAYKEVQAGTEVPPPFVLASNEDCKMVSMFLS